MRLCSEFHLLTIAVLLFLSGSFSYCNNALQRRLQTASYHVSFTEGSCACVFTERAAAAVESTASVPIYPSPRVLSDSWGQWATRSRRWVSLGPSILSFSPWLLLPSSLACSLSVLCRRTLTGTQCLHSCLSHRQLCSVSGKDNLVLTLTFPVLLPCWPLCCLPNLSGCSLQFR